MNCSVLQITANGYAPQNYPARTCSEISNPFDSDVLCHLTNPIGAKNGALPVNPVLSQNDGQALGTIITLWSGLSLEGKIKVMRAIEAIAKADTPKPSAEPPCIL